jgi:hypothetical protein
LLRTVAHQVNLDAGDIVPAIDIELDPLPAPGTEVGPSWSAPCEELTNLVVEAYGDAIIYITKREFELLGSPAWVLQRPLWVAHYTKAQAPATPNNVPAAIWQYRVGPFDPQGQGGYDRQRPELDHNRGLTELPLINAMPDAGLDDLRDQAALTQFDADIITSSPSS